MITARAGRVPVPVKRTLALLVAVICAAALLSGCGSAGDPAAAKVGSTTIRRSALDDELRELADNKAWIKAVQPNFGADLAAPTGGVNTQLSAAWLQTLVNQEVVDRVFAQRHLTVTPEIRTAAKQSTLGILAGAKTSNRFPRWFRDEVARRQQRYAAVAASLPPRTAPTDAVLQEFFSRVGTQLCPSNLAILEIKVATKEAADAIVTDLAGGADFGTLARDRSTDTTTGPNGGLAACKDTPQYNQLPEAMRQVITPLASGSVSQPLQTTDGFQVFKVVAWDYAVAHDVLVQLYDQQQATPIQQLVDARLVKTKHIWIDPRYGTLVRSGGTVRIHPPKPPSPRSNPKLTPSTTTPAGASGQ